MRQRNESAHVPEYEIFMEVLREARTETGIGQERLSKMLGRSRHYIYTCEHGSRRVDAVELREIALALKLDPVELYARFIAAVEIGKTNERT